jgi:hypothetical protein
VQQAIGETQTAELLRARDSVLVANGVPPLPKPAPPPIIDA